MDNVGQDSMTGLALPLLNYATTVLDTRNQPQVDQGASKTSPAGFLCLVSHLATTLFFSKTPIKSYK